MKKIDNKKLKVAFMIESNFLTINEYKIYEYVLLNSKFDRPILLSSYKEKKPFQNKREIFKNHISNLRIFKATNLLIYLVLLKLINFTEFKKIKKLIPYFNEKKFINKSEYSFHKVNGLWSKSSSDFCLDSSSLNKIKKMNLDLIVLLGKGIIKGEILNIPKFGVISIIYGNGGYKENIQVGFWEVFNSEKTSFFTIQRLIENKFIGDVLFRGNIRTLDLWIINKNILINKSIFAMKSVLSNLAEKRVLLKENYSYLYDKRLIKNNEEPTLLIRYLIKIYYPKIRNFFKNIFFRKKVSWSIAFKNNSDLSYPLSKYNEIKNPKNCYLADPFVITYLNKTICFAEEFNYSSNKGRIIAYELIGDSYQYLGIAIEEKFHLSFPYVFEFDNQIFMIPETSANKQIRLYKCKNYPLNWELYEVMIDKIEGVDTLLINRNKLWYLLTNKCSAGLKKNCSELHIFWNDNFMKGKWRPLKSPNPIIFNAEGGRNGGIFKKESKLYRISQNHQTNNYGSSFNINEIKSISKETYKEEFIQKIYPGFKKGIIGTHHFNSNGEYSVIDFKRMI